MCSHQEKHTDNVGKMTWFCQSDSFPAEGGQQQAPVGSCCSGQWKELVAGNGAPSRKAVQEVFMSSTFWYLFYANICTNDLRPSCVHGVKSNLCVGGEGA